jgi:hypothetical protein
MHELIRIEPLQRLGAGLLADALAHKGSVDAGAANIAKPPGLLRRKDDRV